jgi:hypothetical protein
MGDIGVMGRAVVGLSPMGDIGVMGRAEVGARLTEGHQNGGSLPVTGSEGELHDAVAAADDRPSWKATTRTTSSGSS